MTNISNKVFNGLIAKHIKPQHWFKLKSHKKKGLGFMKKIMFSIMVLSSITATTSSSSFADDLYYCYDDKHESSCTSNGDYLEGWIKSHKKHSGLDCGPCEIAKNHISNKNQSLLASLKLK